MKEKYDISDTACVATAESQHEVNEYLKLGWRLLKILAAKREDRDWGEFPHYVLGWPRNPEKPVKYPKENSRF